MDGENSNTTNKLEDLAEKSTNKGVTANYIVACQALRDDIFAFFSSKFEIMQKEIISLKKEVEKCNQREEVLMKRITALTSNTVPNGDSQNKDDIYLVGSSILREIKSDDIVNGTVQGSNFKFELDRQMLLVKIHLTGSQKI